MEEVQIWGRQTDSQPRMVDSEHLLSIYLYIAPGRKWLNASALCLLTPPDRDGGDILFGARVGRYQEAISKTAGSVGVLAFWWLPGKPPHLASVIVFPEKSVLVFLPSGSVRNGGLRGEHLSHIKAASRGMIPNGKLCPSSQAQGDSRVQCQPKHSHYPHCPGRTGLSQDRE